MKKYLIEYIKIVAHVLSVTGAFYLIICTIEGSSAIAMYFTYLAFLTGFAGPIKLLLER